MMKRCTFLRKIKDMILYFCISKKYKSWLWENLSVVTYWYGERFSIILISTILPSFVKLHLSRKPELWPNLGSYECIRSGSSSEPAVSLIGNSNGSLLSMPSNHDNRPQLLPPRVKWVQILLIPPLIFFRYRAIETVNVMIWMMTQLQRFWNYRTCRSCRT